MSLAFKNKKRIISWLSRHSVVVMLIAVIGGLVPAFGFVSMAISQNTTNQQGVIRQDIGDNETARIEAEDFNQFGRIVFSFDNSFALPEYELMADNGVLIVIFKKPIDFSLPDISETLPNFVVASRIDPDKKGIRFALKRNFRINKTDVGERLYVDILPEDWSGPLPALPKEVVEELSNRAKNAMLLAEQKRKVEYIKENKPQASVRIGRHPTFIRMQIEWDIDVNGGFTFEDNIGEVKFDWPIKLDLTELNSDLPDEIISVTQKIVGGDNIISIEVEDNITARFYANSKRQYIVDIDLNKINDNEVDLSSLLFDNAKKSKDSGDIKEDTLLIDNQSDVANKKSIIITPVVEQMGSTIRMTFPFEDETSAAVFRRGSTLWMVFDSFAKITNPENSKELSSIVDKFSVVGAGGASVVRIELRSSKLATLGSEGRSWVLSIGDLMLDSVELFSLTRRQTASGLFEIVADLKRPAKVHQLRDPEVGDVLEVVTAFPPARGIARDLSLVEFSALRSIHGLVIKPLHDKILVGIDGEDVIISSKKGLIVSSSKGARANKDVITKSSERDGYIDFSSMQEDNPIKFFNGEREIMQRASTAERNMLGIIRLQLAQYYLANNLYYEAIGMLNLVDKDRTFSDLDISAMITRAAALVFASRPKDALIILYKKEVDNVVDAMVWRAIANNKVGAFAKAQKDALASEAIIDTYPSWVRVEFFLAATESAIEVGDNELATRYISKVETSNLNIEKINRYKVLLARIDASEGRYDQALDGLGQVIATDSRPGKASAIYYTMVFLKDMNRLDIVKGAKTLATEAIVWRNNDLEVKMMGLLGKMYFDAGSYREAFDVTNQLVKARPKSDAAKSLMNISQATFSDIFLNGEAESLPPIKALSLYYDYRYLTPVGARGDEMIRNLAKRLVKVDLLEQASELLQYQVDERLEGVAKAQIAADLAVVYLADRLPEKAIRVLHDTNLAGIPLSLKRQRKILESKALIEVGREDLALDILSSINGKDADLLKVDAHWSGKRYMQAAEIIEQLYSSDLAEDRLTIHARTNLIKAAVGFVLANDQIGLTRLRLKYGQAMAKTTEWGMFDFVSSKVDASSLEFKKVANQVANKNSLELFLKAYSENYGADGALAPKSES